MGKMDYGARLYIHGLAWLEIPDIGIVALDYFNSETDFKRGQFPIYAIGAGDFTVNSFNFQPYMPASQHPWRLLALFSLRRLLSIGQIGRRKQGGKSASFSIISIPKSKTSLKTANNRADSNAH